MIVGLITSLLFVISPYLLFGIRPYLQIWDLDTALLVNSSHFSPYHTYTTVYLVTFLTGFPFGYLMHKGTVKLSKMHVRVSWLSSICAILGVYFWNNTFWRSDHSSSLINVILWLTIGKATSGDVQGFRLINPCCRKFLKPNCRLRQDQESALVNIRWIDFWHHDVRPSKMCITEIDQVK